MHSGRMFLISLVLLGIGALKAAGAGEVDLSSPQASARSLYQAMQSEDEQAILKIFYTPQSSDRELAESYAQLLVSTKKLAVAAKKKYGAGGDAIGAGTVGPEALAQIDRATVKITGDSAMLAMPGQAQPVTFHRTGDQWQIMLSDFAGDAEGRPRQQITLLKKVSDTLSDTAGEIEADKYPTAQSAEAAIQGRLGRVMIRAATQAASRPVGKPQP